MLDSLSLRWAIIALLLMFSQFSCKPVPVQTSAITESFDVPFELVYADSTIECPATFVHNQQNWQIDRLALFISDIAIKEAQNEQWTRVSLLPNDWQTNDVALLWFATDCPPTMISSVSNTQLSLASAGHNLATATALRFSLAVPFALNHANPLLQSPPLNIPEMFWSWRMGYKFLRFDISAVPTNEHAPWSFHLGSVGCVSESVVRPPNEACAQPNRFTVEVELTRPLAGLKFDLATLLQTVHPERMGHCMLQPAMLKECAQLFANLQQENLIRQ